MLDITWVKDVVSPRSEVAKIGDQPVAAGDGVGFAKGDGRYAEDLLRWGISICWNQCTGSGTNGSKSCVSRSLTAQCEATDSVSRGLR
jgi:hypothetical protein